MESAPMNPRKMDDIVWLGVKFIFWFLVMVIWGKTWK